MFLMRSIKVVLAASCASLFLATAGTSTAAIANQSATPSVNESNKVDPQITQTTVNLSCSPKGGYGWNAEVVLHSPKKKLKVYYEATIKDEDGTYRVSSTNGYINTSAFGNGSSNTAYGSLKGEGSVDLEVTVGNIPGSASVSCPAV
ncbi:hypothetical protein [Brevibacterium aurantiacum]|uniref:hypothetical protein n=1 Tax=Brevibacterium aurantiacum TaxID=273384 RepID=UPI001055B02B|nr:hypothetical protein [Brevibacterium aurantiacum]